MEQEDLCILVAVVLKKGEFSRIERRMGKTLSTLGSDDDISESTGAPLRGNVKYSMDSGDTSTGRPTEEARGASRGWERDQNTKDG